jgi:cell division protein FtsA
MSKSILAIDIGTTNIVSIVAKNDLNKKINILGIGKISSQGVKNGTIVDIDLASNCINDSITLARSSSGISIDSTLVSINDMHTRNRRSSGYINVPSGHITIKEINQVLTMALYDAQIVPDFEIIHVIPLYFKIDDNNVIENPLNMNGSRLEVYANIITAKKTTLTNIKNALKKSNIDVDNFILSSYASTIATLNDEQKSTGTAVIDMGGSTSKMSIFKNRSITYNTAILIGSQYITSDLSTMLNTPLSAADEVKKQYASLISKNEHELENTITKVKIPVLGNEHDSKEISLDLIQPIIHARVEETLCLLHDKLKSSGLDDTIKNIVLTGGMSKIYGIETLAQRIFTNFSVKVSKPKNIQNGYIDFNDETLSTIVGILIYGLDEDPFFELDSKGILRKKEFSFAMKPEKVVKEEIEDNNESLINTKISKQPDNELSIKINTNNKPTIPSKIWKKFAEWI